MFGLSDSSIQAHNSIHYFLVQHQTQGITWRIGSRDQSQIVKWLNDILKTVRKLNTEVSIIILLTIIIGGSKIMRQSFGRYVLLLQQF